MTTVAVDAVVVGGGVAGLVRAERLAGEGRRTLVLETAAEPGGCVRFHDVGGLRLDRGAESFATARPAVAALADRLGLATELPVGGPAWVHHAGGDAPLPTATVLGIPAHPMSAQVRRVIGWTGASRALLDAVMPGARAAERLGDLVATRMGRRVVQRLVEPVVAGVYSSDPVGVDVDAVAPGLRAAMWERGSLAAGVAALRGGGASPGSAVAGITGGMARLTEALVAELRRHGGELRCRATVTGLAGRSGRWVVTATGETGESLEIEAGSVVVATPATLAAALVGAATAGVARLPVAPVVPVVVVTLVVDDDRLAGAPRGNGVLVAPSAGDVVAKALTHATAKWAWLAAAAGPIRHVLRLSYGQGGALPDDAEFPHLALEDASRLLGVPLTTRHLLDHAVVRYPDQLWAPQPGRADAVARFTAALTAFPGLTVCGSAVAGTGLAAVVSNAAPAMTGGIRNGAGWGHDHDRD